MKVAFAGLMRSGKDTAAEYAVECFGGEIHKFADGLYKIHNHAISPGATKDSTLTVAYNTVFPHLLAGEVAREREIFGKLSDFLQEWFRDPREWFQDPSEFTEPVNQDLYRTEGVKNRYFLQCLGTEWARYTIHPDIWVRIFLKGLAPNNDANVFCTDLRFHNECKVLHANGFVIVRVERPEAARMAAGASNVAHPSETDIPFLDVDFSVYNRSTLEDYYAKLDLLLAPSGIRRLNSLRT